MRSTNHTKRSREVHLRCMLCFIPASKNTAQAEGLIDNDQALHSCTPKDIDSYVLASLIALYKCVYLCHYSSKLFPLPQ